MFNTSYVCRHVVCDIYGGKFFASSHEPNCFHDPLKEYVKIQKIIFICQNRTPNHGTPSITNKCMYSGRTLPNNGGPQIRVGVGKTEEASQVQCELNEPLRRKRRSGRKRRPASPCQDPCRSPASPSSAARRNDGPRRLRLRLCAPPAAPHLLRARTARR